jgi:hypothetical protein
VHACSVSAALEPHCSSFMVAMCSPKLEAYTAIEKICSTASIQYQTACGLLNANLFVLLLLCCCHCEQVCTGQYFAWHMCMLPLLAPSLGLVGSTAQVTHSSHHHYCYCSPLLCTVPCALLLLLTGTAAELICERITACYVHAILHCYCSQR